MLNTFDFHDGNQERKEDGYALTLKFYSLMTDKSAEDIKLMMSATDLVGITTTIDGESPEQTAEREREGNALIRHVCIATIDVIRSFRSLLNIDPFQYKDGKCTGMLDEDVLALFYKFQEFMATEKKNIEIEPSLEPSMVVEK